MSRKSGLKKLLGRIRLLARSRKKKLVPSAKGSSWTSYSTPLGHKLASVSYIVGRVKQIAQERSGTTGEIKSVTLVTPEGAQLSIPCMGRVKVGEDLVLPYML